MNFQLLFPRWATAHNQQVAANVICLHVHKINIIQTVIRECPMLSIASYWNILIGMSHSLRKISLFGVPRRVQLIVAKLRHSATHFGECRKEKNKTDPVIHITSDMDPLRSYGNVHTYVTTHTIGAYLTWVRRNADLRERSVSGETARRKVKLLSHFTSSPFCSVYAMRWTQGMRQIIL